ncbi:MAG TPA: TRAP transporter substrate-binding protein DctP [Spirochaetia bacterium]|nr:TRAP transporter substrate-binding protein DctP [Spirochaetia bacterium]
MKTNGCIRHVTLFRPMLILALMIAATGLSAQSLQIKLASVAPENSPYGTALNQLANNWERLSGGTVQVVIYPNGIAGDQSDMLRKMRIGQLQGGIFASTGLTTVAKAALAVSVPFLIRNEAHLASAMQALRPILNRDAESKGLTAVAWADVGWMYLFSRTPVKTPEQAKALRLAVPPDQQSLIEAFKALGYRPVPVDIPETLTALNSGLVDAFFASPSLAAGYQWFAVAPYLVDMRIAPVIGAILVDTATWRRLPAELRTQFVASARKTEIELQKALAALDEKAITIMQGYGLKVLPVSDAEKSAWQNELQEHEHAIIGPVFDRSIVELIKNSMEKVGATGE